MEHEITFTFKDGMREAEYVFCKSCRRYINFYLVDDDKYIHISRYRDDFDDQVYFEEGYNIYQITKNEKEPFGDCRKVVLNAGRDKKEIYL